MLSSPGEAACNCTIASARLILEASGFVVSGRHSPYLGSSYSASKRDEVFTLYCAIVAGLVLIAGLMSGLTLGLMSLDGLDLEVLRRSGTALEQKYAKAIEPVIKRPHWLLVTLVLVNAAATEALPLFLDRLADPITAVVLSVTVVLIFGEIIPQAVCSRHGLAVGARSAWFVQILMWTFAVIAYPISKILDYLLGQEHTALFRRAQLKALVDAHGLKEGLGGNLSHDEITVIRGALDLTHKTAADCMTPWDKVFMLPSDAILEEVTLGKIISSGHSRVPIHHPGNRHKVIGVILVKELAMIDKTARTPVSTLKMRSLPFLRGNTPLYDLLRLFETGRCHMAVLTEPSEPNEGAKFPWVNPADPPSDPHPTEVLQRHHSDGMHAHLMQQQQHSDGMQNGHVIQRQASEGNQLISADHDGLMHDEDAQGEHPGAQGQPPVGVITLEDCLEELIQQEIVDETDRYVDNEQRQRVNAQLMLRNLPRLRKMLLSRQFHPRIGALAAVNMNRRHQDSQRLLSAMDMLKPILAESPEKEGEHGLHHGQTRGQAAIARPGTSQRVSETGSASHIV
ncbi:MAG: hypothetical protein FRX49_04443 [Trebouxia sp. A1-2]|nr:MAG: hypothetical protein FRX49_04443 [Trebouxia sp. A1-2]